MVCRAGDVRGRSGHPPGGDAHDVGADARRGGGGEGPRGAAHPSARTADRAAWRALRRDGRGPGRRRFRSGGGASAIAADIAANDLGSGIATWIVRTLTFPTHAALTIWTGAALGLALDARRAWSRPLLALAGLLVAIGAHGAINHGNVAGATDQASFFMALGPAFGWIVVSTILAVTLRLVLTRRV
ncbi:MAG: PrsW family intramembrane metalloprotease [Microbacterium sp.]|nr:PrsW family intramembrane metalloprotease [Microbacterium sp.]